MLPLQRRHISCEGKHSVRLFLKRQGRASRAEPRPHGMALRQRCGKGHHPGALRLQEAGCAKGCAAGTSARADNGLLPEILLLELCERQEARARERKKVTDEERKQFPQTSWNYKYTALKVPSVEPPCPRSRHGQPRALLSLRLFASHPESSRLPSIPGAFCHPCSLTQSHTARTRHDTKVAQHNSDSSSFLWRKATTSPSFTAHFLALAEQGSASGCRAA